MTLEEVVLEFIVDEFGGCVVVALYLVANDFYLLVKLCLGIGGVEDDVGKEVNGPCCMVVKDGGIVDGRLLGGVSLQVASYAFEAVENVPCPATLVPLKVVCSQKWARPSSPGSSSREPAWI